MMQKNFKDLLIILFLLFCWKFGLWIRKTNAKSIILHICDHEKTASFSIHFLTTTVLPFRYFFDESATSKVIEIKQIYLQSTNVYLWRVFNEKNLDYIRRLKFGPSKFSLESFHVNLLIFEGFGHAFIDINRFVHAK